jgi:hypothetical protein
VKRLGSRGEEPLPPPGVGSGLPGRDTIAFNQLLSGEIAGAITEFQKKIQKGRRASGRPDKGGQTRLLADRRRGQHKAKPLHI